VGQYAIQLGSHAGLRVVADARPEDEELVRGFGASEVIARSDDPGAAFRLVAPFGVDGLIDAAVIDANALVQFVIAELWPQSDSGMARANAASA